MPRRSSPHRQRSTRPVFSSRLISRDSALWLRWTASAQLLGPELMIYALGQPLQDFEVAHAEAVPLPQLTLERGAHGGVPGGQRTPGTDHLVGPGLVHEGILVTWIARCKYINCTCI